MVALSFIPDFHPKVDIVATQSETEALLDGTDYHLFTIRAELLKDI